MPGVPTPFFKQLKTNSIWFALGTKSKDLVVLASCCDYENSVRQLWIFEFCKIQKCVGAILFICVFNRIL